MSYLISIGKVVGKLLATLIAWALVLGYSFKILNYLYPAGEGGANSWVALALSIGAAVAAWWILSSGDSEEGASSSIEPQKGKNDDLSKHKKYESGDNKKEKPYNTSILDNTKGYLIGSLKKVKKRLKI